MEQSKRIAQIPMEEYEELIRLKKMVGETDNVILYGSYYHGYFTSIKMLNSVEAIEEIKTALETANRVIEEKNKLIRDLQYEAIFYNAEESQKQSDMIAKLQEKLNKSSWLQKLFK